MDSLALDHITDLVTASIIVFPQLIGRIHETTARSRYISARSEDLTAWSRRLRSASRRLRRPICGSSEAEMPRSDRTLDKVRRGGLPAPLNRQLWVGPGSNKPCNGCGERINGEERDSK